jgi:hypothetical protein
VEDEPPIEIASAIKPGSTRGSAELSMVRSAAADA